VTPTFWQRHHHDELIARWAAIVGTERVTGIVVDERDHGMVLRAFESLTGLRPGTLAVQDDLANRSLTLPEIEMVRQINILFSEAGISRPQHSMLVNFGATDYLKTLPVDPAAPKVALPPWTIERVSELAREIVDGIRATDIRLIGDLDSLLVVPPVATAQPLHEVTRIPASVAGRLAMGVLYGADLARPGVGAPRRRILPPRMAEPIDITRIPTVTLTKALARRVIPGLKRG